MSEEFMERRMQYLQRIVSSQGERIARLETLEPAIASLRTSVDSLTATLNKGKGAIWIVGTLGVAVGSAIHFVLDYVGKR